MKSQRNLSKMPKKVELNFEYTFYFKKVLLLYMSLLTLNLLINKQITL